MKSFLITTLGIVANIVPVIPAGIGIYDLSYLPIFAIFRIPLKFGIAVILLRRLLNLLLAVVGLVPMLRMKTKPPVAEPAAAACPRRRQRPFSSVQRGQQVFSVYGSRWTVDGKIKFQITAPNSQRNSG